MRRIYRFCVIYGRIWFFRMAVFVTRIVVNHNRLPNFAFNRGRNRGRDMASSRSQPKRYCKMACKVAHPALETAETAPTARHARSASKRQLRRRGNAQPSDAAPRRLKSGDSSAVQMPLVWGRRRIYFSAKSCLMAAAGLAFLRFFLFPSSSSSLQRLH